MRRPAALGIVVTVALVAAACSSTSSSSTTTTGGSGPGTTSGGGSPSIPQSAFSDHTGVSASSVQVANVSTLSLGLFKGAQVGTQAYADYVNSTGGVNGRKIVVNNADDGFTGAGNKQATQNALQNDFALVGDFSLEDSFGGTVLAQNPGFPDVSQVLDHATTNLPNVYSAVPLNDGWEEGPIQYFKKKFPSEVRHVGALVADSPSAAQTWAGEEYVMQKVGYDIVYQSTYATTQTDFTQNVIAMKNAGVKILFIDQMPPNYASSVLKALTQQDFHPQVVLGAATYSNQLVAQSGGPAAVNGSYLDQNASLYLGGDAAAIPAVGTFLHWVQVASPGFQPDLFTMYGWVSAELFAQALKNAGSNPSRGSLLQALGKTTTFTGGNIVTPSNPSTKSTSNCYLIGQVQNGSFVRVDDPPVSSSTNGYRCDYSYVKKPGT
ncbi:MAG TPA: ABC transporter substrate-binding protein [Acidimicrobiales bacterium]|nr:ABC transporter substrate-binding protein [Acidimicrobiales bacterium]